MNRPTALALAVATALQTQSALAQSDDGGTADMEKSFRAVRVDTAPVIDGRLDDAVWERAAVITDFHQTQPEDHGEASEPTELYVVYTEDALYIGARMYDPEPGRIAAPTIRHGEGLGGDDRLVLILDPFNTRRTGYRFETNLNAVRHEALYQNVSSFQIEWDTIWDTATSLEDDAWVAELEIPFKSLPFDPAIDEWGFNFGRGIRRRGEEIAWVSQDRTYNPSIAGTMTGMEGMDKGLGLDIVPSMSVNRNRGYDPATSDTGYEPSLDAFYRLTPSLNAALTINTDFSATEVDNRQVNLTRFSLFFPEKRDFFLKDSDLFQFGDINGMAGGNAATSGSSRENARPYFSRKIGLSETGAPVDIEYGGRISGRVGRWNIGTLAVRQSDFGTTEATNLLVTRMSANVLEDSEVGFIYTDGDPASNVDNRVMGVDFNYLDNSFLGDRRLSGSAFYQQSDTPGLDGDDASWGFGIQMPNSAGLRSRIGFKEVQRNFNPAMGYVNRSNVRDYTGDVGYTYFFQEGIFQQAFAGIDVQRINVIGDGLQSQSIVYRLLELQTDARDQIQFRLHQNRENVRNAFTLYSSPARSVSVTPGNYRFDEHEMRINTGSQRDFSASFGYRAGDFYNGERTNLSAGLRWNQSRYFKASLDYDWNDISLPQGDFITRLASLSTEVAFSSTLYWINLLQYDNLSEELGINTRLQWIPQAGQEAFIVLNHNMQDYNKDNTFESAYSDLTVKLRYTFRF